MLKNLIRNTKYFSVIALFFFPIRRAASASLVPAFNADNPAYQLYYFWDLRGRESFLRLSNESSSLVSVHIQVFDAAHYIGNDCELLDVIETYIGHDSHNGKKSYSKGRDRL